MKEKIEQWLGEIDLALKREDYIETAELSRKLLLENPQDLGAVNFIQISVIFGFSLIKVGQIDQAVNVLKSLIKSGLGLVDSSFLLFSLAYEDNKMPEVFEYGKLYMDCFDDPEKRPESFTSASKNISLVANDLGKALIDNGQLEEAIEVIEKAIKHQEDFELLYVNLGVAYHRMEKFGKAEETFLNGLKKCESPRDLNKIAGQFYEEYNFFYKAEYYFNEAVNDGDTTSLLDMGILYNKMFKLKDAEEVLESYLEVTPGDPIAEKMVTEIRNHPYFEKDEMKISAVMIVRNEEANIEECIESIREAVDEIIVVDTGSTDGTIAILKEFDVKLFEFAWKDDFSAARNFAISKATGDWIISIDADERLDREDIVKLREAKFKDNYNALCVSILLNIMDNTGGVSFGKQNSPRIFRNSENNKYSGVVNESIDLNGKIGLTDIKFYHLGSSVELDKKNIKFSDSIELLKKQADKDSNDPTAQLSLAGFYLERGFHAEALSYAESCLELLKKDSDADVNALPSVLSVLASIKLLEENHVECRAYCQEALEISDNCLDSFLTLGWSYYLNGEFDESVKYLEKYSARAGELINTGDLDPSMLKTLGKDYEVNYLLGEIYIEFDDPASAKLKFEESLESNSMYWNTYNSLGFLYKEEGNTPKATELFEKALKYGFLNEEQYGITGRAADEFAELKRNYMEIVEGK